MFTHHIRLPMFTHHIRFPTFTRHILFLVAKTTASYIAPTFFGAQYLRTGVEQFWQ